MHAARADIVPPPTDKTVWMLIGGAVLCVAGAVGLFSGRK